MSTASRKFALPLILFALGCSTPQVKPLSPTERAQFLIEIAGAALTEGDSTSALVHLNDAEKLDPNISELHYIRALAYNAKGDAVSAISEARVAVKLNPKLSNANNALGKLLLDAGKNSEATPYLLKAATDPLNHDAFKPLTSLGILYYRKGQFKKAREVLDKATQASKNESCIAYYYKGHLDLREARFKEAIANYHAASNQYCAKFAEGHLALALAYEKSGQYDLARRKYLEIEQQFHSTQFAQQAIDHLIKLP